MKELRLGWCKALEEEWNRPYYKELQIFLDEQYATATIYPPREEIFNAMAYTDLSEVKVLIVGQDPYHNEGQAHGLSFSTRPGQPLPKSLVNIYKEMESDLGQFPANNGCLTKWAQEGVLLLNTVLTVRAHEPHSHSKKGWEIFTDQIIRKVNEENRPIVIFLWGKPAQLKKKLLTNPRHLILEAPHPSPLSAYRGFFGCRCFSKCNQFLVDNNVEPIDWKIE